MSFKNFLNKNKKLIFIYFPLLFIFFAVLYVFTVYLQWNEKRDTILSRLKEYKRFIDYTEDIQDGFRIGGFFSPGIQDTAIGVPSKIFDYKGRLIGEFFHERREVIPLKNIPKNVILSVIANEDADFMEHNGINYKGIIRAFFVNIFTLSYRQGGSTLTQQLAKVLFTEGQKTIKRKIFEAFCALEIEKNYDKQDILAMYLNLIYFGKGIYGIEEASRTYFNKSANYLNLAEAAMLVGIIPNPNYYNPVTNIGIAYVKTRSVLNRLVSENIITQQERQEVLVKFRRRWRIQLIAGHPQGGKTLIGLFAEKNFSLNKAPHFNERIRRILARQYDIKTLKQSGLKIYTTLDLDKQAVAEELLTKVIQKQRDYHLKRAAAFLNKGRGKDAQLEASKAKDINGALVSLNPQTGNIEAYVAGFEFSTENQLDRVSQIQRQPGSSFKPFVYLSAIEDRTITQATIFEDKEISINGYSPGNYDNKFYGNMTARDALRKSINTIAVQVLYKTGFDRLFEFLQAGLDISDRERRKRFPPVYSLALGTSELSPLEHVALHSMIANGGKFIIPYGFRYVEDYSGKIVFDNESIIQGRLRKRKFKKDFQVISPESAYVVIRMLKGFFEPGVYGNTLKNRYKINFPIAGKTGTSSNHVDAWFVGYTPDLVTSLWLGNDAGNISLGPGHSGGSLLAPLWTQYISKIRNSIKKEDFAKPAKGLVMESFCLESGLVPHSATSCPNQAREEPFLAGTEPGEYCPLHR